MIKFSTKSQYGLRAMVYLAKCQNKVCPLKIISKEEGIPFDYLEKILSKLEKANLIRAKKGVQGGYFLVRKPKNIKLGEIIKVLEGEMVLVRCIDKKRKHICPREKECLTKNFWKKIQDSLISTLNSLTLADLINPEGKPSASYGARK